MRKDCRITCFLVFGFLREDFLFGCLWYSSLRLYSDGRRFWTTMKQKKAQRNNNSAPFLPVSKIWAALPPPRAAQTSRWTLSTPSDQVARTKMSLTVGCFESMCHLPEDIRTTWLPGSDLDEDVFPLLPKGMEIFLLW